MNSAQTMIRYSFLIPFWNLEYRLLQRMLDSIPHREDVEIIVLDNASDDIDKENFPGKKDPCTSVIFQTERKTVGYCRNRLLEAARGEWIIFADADDRFITDQLERVMEMPQKDQYDLIYWGLETLYTSGETREDCLGYRGTEIVPLESKDHLLMHRYESPIKMAKRQLIMAHKEIRYEDMPIYEDVAYSVRLLLHAEKVGVYPQIVYQYFRRDTSTLGQTRQGDVIENVFVKLFPIFDIQKENHFKLEEQEISKKCLIRIKDASKWRFYRSLYKEYRRYGWKLFYRDLVGARFETYESNLLKAIIDHIRVKIGYVLHRSLKI